MRDIRDDLKERVHVLEMRMRGAQGLFEEQVEQLKRQRDSTLAELKIKLDAISRVVQIEQQRFSRASQPQQTTTDIGRLRRAV
jgi:hypothetical protein